MQRGRAAAPFTLAFADLLYWHEIIVLAAMIAAGVKSGLWLGQLKLLSRDLRGSDLSDVIWGSYAALNMARAQIMTAMKEARLSQERVS